MKGKERNKGGMNRTLVAPELVWIHVPPLVTVVNLDDEAATASEPRV